MLRLESQTGDSPTRAFESGNIMIGTDSSNELCLGSVEEASRQIDRFQLRISGSGNQWWLIPSSRRYPTELNGRPVTGRARLSSGDRIQLDDGRIELCVAIEQEPARQPDRSTGPCDKDVTTGATARARTPAPRDRTPATGYLARDSGAASQDHAATPVSEHLDETAATQEREATDTPPASPEEGLPLNTHLLLLAILVLSATGLGAKLIAEVLGGPDPELAGPPLVDVRTVTLGYGRDDGTDDGEADGIRALFRKDLASTLMKLELVKRNVPDEAFEDILVYLEAMRWPRTRRLENERLPYIVQVFKSRGVPSPLAALPWVESQFDPAAESKAHAVGMWQFTWGTFEATGGRPALSSYDERLDWKRQTEVAADHFKELLATAYPYWDPLMVVASYNCSLARLKGDIDTFRKESPEMLEARPDTSIFWILREQGLIPAETGEYVPRFLAAAVYFQYYDHYPDRKHAGQ